MIPVPPSKRCECFPFFKVDGTHYPPKAGTAMSVEKGTELGKEKADEEPVGWLAWVTMAFIVSFSFTFFQIVQTRVTRNCMNEESSGMSSLAEIMIGRLIIENHRLHSYHGLSITSIMVVEVCRKWSLMGERID